jgi:leader peptidase (prepilin peptidase)/N-methyltransferase
MQGNLLTLFAASEFRDPLLPLWVMESLAIWFLWFWLFCVGATVGSFLNVVVYRLPRGLNLAYPGSFCPHCGHAIRLQDNIPILSWLNLRGRCRDCGWRISPRYLLVELTVASAFLVVLAAEHYLPAGMMGLRTRHVLHVRDGAPFWCMYFLHVTLVTTLIGAILLRSDGNPVPATLFLPVIVVGLVLPLIWPDIRSVPASGSWELRGWQAGLADGLAGVAGGLLIAFVLMPFARKRGWGPAAVISFCCCVGVVLGWQRGIVVAAVGWPMCVSLTGVLSKISARPETNDKIASEVSDLRADSTGNMPVVPITSETPLPPESEAIGEKDLTSNAGQPATDASRHCPD